jgi:hypothetical protein
MADPILDNVAMIIAYTEQERMDLRVNSDLQLMPDCADGWKDIFLKTGDNKKGKTPLILATFLYYSAGYQTHRMFHQQLGREVTVHMYKFIPESKARFKRDLGL